MISLGLPIGTWTRDPFQENGGGASFRSMGEGYLLGAWGKGTFQEDGEGHLSGGRERGTFQEDADFTLRSMGEGSMTGAWVVQR